MDLFAAPERRRTRPASRVHLLTYGIGVCGVCGGPLRMARRSGEPYYVCTSREECVGRVQKYVDQYVADTVIEWLSRPDAVQWLVPDGTALADARSRETKARDLLIQAGHEARHR